MSDAPVFIEFPGDEIVEVHFKAKEPDDGGGGGDGGLCIPHYAHPYMPLYLYVDGTTLWVQPHTCCPPTYLNNELDYGQKTVWGGGAPKTTLTWTWNPSDGGTGSGAMVEPAGMMGIWIYPQVKFNSWDKVWIYRDGASGNKLLLAPKGDPVLMVPVNVLTYDLMPNLTQSDIPGAPQPDPDVFGTTIVLAPLYEDELGWHPYINSPYVFDGSVIEIEHECPPSSSPTAGPDDIPHFQRRAR